MEEKKKLSTAEILARARAQKAAAAAEAAAGEAPAEAASSVPAAEVASVPEVSAVEAPAAKSAAPSAGGAPKSTKDILAAARAQAAAKAAGGEPAAEAPAAAPVAAKPAAGGAKSTKDILAAARAQAAAKAAGGDAAAVESPAAPKAAAAKSATKPAAGGTPSVQEMLKAVREGKTAEATASVVAEKPAVTAKIPSKPPAPSKSPAAKGKAESGPRRNFLLAILAAPFALAWTLLSITGLAAVLGAARFMFPNAIVEPPSKFKVGPPGEYPNGTVSNKWKAMFGIWIVNADFQGKSLIYALSTVCTHLGCTPSWLDGEQKFKCPCHGSGFYITGINFEGPAPRPLERYAIRVAEDGMLEVDKSQKFQQEIGQWDDPKSFVEIA